MYGFLWRSIPGPAWLKTVIFLAVLVGIFFLLMEVVFPYVDQFMPYTDVSVDGQ
ncbi:MAG: hypothetical protein Q3972_04065 [Corynebacterium sp.]|nr:hypothetical protein [Corynebacterium sp.]